MIRKMLFEFRLLGFLLLLCIPAIAQAAETRAAENTQEAGRRWNKMDKDGDGKIAKDEAEGLMKRFFDRNDADKDGFLDRGELADLAKRLSEGRNRNAQQRGNPNARNNANRNKPALTTEDLQKRVPEGVIFIPDIAYREGNEAWKLDLAMPEERGDEPRAAIVFVHGGGWVKGDKRSGAFAIPTLEFAAKGYVCINVNYRLDASKKPCIEDVKCAVRWLRAHAQKYNVDPKRFGAYGNSAGAHLVTMLGICPASAGLEGDGPWQEFSSMVQAVVASATPTVPRLRDGSEEDEKKIQPMSYVSADAPPFLLVHEESDRTVDVSNSDDFVKALKKAGAKDVTYLHYTDGSGHGVFQKNINETGPAREKFFERTLRKK